MNRASTLARHNDTNFQSAWLKIRQLSGRARPPPDSTGGSRKSPLDFLDQVPENLIFYGIIGTNGAIFLMWFLAKKRYEVEGDSTALRFMYQNFTGSWANFSSGRIWTLLTPMFSHSGFQHILFNMFTFYFLGRSVLTILGTRRFLSLYIGGGLVSSLGSMFWNNSVKGRDPSSLGASGAVFATCSFLACVAPWMTFSIYGIIPVPAFIFTSGVFAFDLYSAMTDKRQGTDTAGHVAGMLAGIGYFLLKRFGL
ncbi:hypothetical protein BDP27DRAFT_1379969 [Rhodocollybia butyracea]|uniref:Peptidase S54 rhomboid domain-containing protein n=1 Tax=Rhodocollybia butyracea TaxID=206335 RepID=A0A9P5UEP2_9AGAR|nr:hypothetical protein BDP27DRAFT_1379969 [Rhodocollybia butyracea]